MPLLFLFLYLFGQTEEVRFARSIDRYASLMTRRSWEVVWPLLLIVVLEVAATAQELAHWASVRGGLDLEGFYQKHLLASLDLSAVAKTLVLQGMVLGVLLLVTTLAVYPFAEVLAALRLFYQPSDVAFARSHRRYFLRSLSLYHVLRRNALYGGVLIGALTAASEYTSEGQLPLLAHVIAMAGPALLGLMVFVAITWLLQHYLARAPAVAKLVEKRLELARAEEVRARYEAAQKTGWKRRFMQVLAVAGLAAVFALWEIVRSHTADSPAMRPLLEVDILVVAPYALLVVAILVRDRWVIWSLRRRYPEVVNGSRSARNP
jgi:hypothetical protein